MRHLFNIIRKEWSDIFRDEGVILIMIAAPLIYATIYSLTYGTEVLTNIPIGVIDHSHSTQSRKLMEDINAGENIHISFNPTDMEQAKRLFFERKIYGIIYIPSDFETRLMRCEQATVATYLDASYMLVYRQSYKELAAIISDFNANIELRHLAMQATAPSASRAIIQPARLNFHTLFNPQQGYGIFVMPPVIILILQQTMLIGVGMLIGTRREREGRNPIQNPAITILCRAIAHSLIYGAIALYLINIHFPLFHYPANGSPPALTLLLSIYLFCCAFMSIALGELFQRRETSLMVMLWSSIPLLMLSGISFPSKAMPAVWRYIALIFPSTHATMGFIKVQTAGATAQQAKNEIFSLIILTVIYFIVAYTIIKKRKLPTQSKTSQHTE